MSETLVFRLLKGDEKDARLLAAVRAVRLGTHEPATHRVEQETFGMVPGSPFAYWLSDDVRRLFAALPSLEGTGVRARVTNPAGDDTRFFRASWEVPSASKTKGVTKRTWVPLAKGGAYSPYYADIHLVVDWDSTLSSYRAFLGTPHRPLVRPANLDLFFRPGLTWPRRTDGLSFRALPGGCAFADKGPALFVPDDGAQALFRVAAILNSRPVLALVHMLLARTGLAQSYEVGLIQSIPVPDLGESTDLASCARSIHDLRRSLDTATENSHAFVVPALLGCSGPTLAARLEERNAEVADAAAKIVVAQREIDERCYRLYAISAEDRATIEAELGTEVRGLPETASGAQAAADLVSWMVGVVLGRFDVRLATGQRPHPELPGPFAALPAASPGMLPEGRVPFAYPIAVDDDGILVDDDGHADDIVAGIRRVLQVLWKDAADRIDKEACALLGVKSLRDYLGKTGKGGFWDGHVRRYSKSRRRAPIYWLLQSPRGLYRVWLYAHRLTKDTLPKLLGPPYLGAKLAQVKHAIEELRPGGEAKPGRTKRDERRLAELDELLLDLEGFAARLRAVTGRTNDRGETVGYAPDLNDGVVLAAAPLHGLIPWPKTRKHDGRTVTELQAYWEELAEGEYDWAHVALLYWPTRVTEKCRQDKSLALAHDLDADFFPGLREELRSHADAVADSVEEAGDLESEEDGEEEAE